MQGQIIDGKKIADEMNSKIKAEVDRIKKENNLVPGLAVILVSDNPASIIYVRNKAQKIKELGMNSFEINLPKETSENLLVKKIESLNNDPKVHGILVQLPLPDHINESAVINAIDPNKDVDGFNVANVGKLSTNQPCFVPCTPLGAMKLIKSVESNISGLKAVVIGRSNIVGKPMAQLALQENCAVTIVHSKVPNIETIVKEADILIAAVGKPNLINSSWIKKDAIIIDVGINRIPLPDGKSKLVGDVDFEDCIKVAKAITPVPGGVGPMTISCLMYNTLKAAMQSKRLTLTGII